MFPRISTVLAVALLLAIASVGTPTTGRIEGGPAEAFAPADVPASAPRAVSNEVVFAPDPAPAPLPRTPAAPSRVPTFTVVGGEGSAPGAATVDDGEALPAIPVPEGWAPAAEPRSRDVLGLGGDDEGAGEGPVFADDPGAGPPGAGSPGAGSEEEMPDAVATGYGPAEDAAPEEEAGFDIVRYEETVEVDSEVVEIGTPVLVVEGYSSWAYGPFHAVRSAPCFDPCFTPPRGACWAPVSYDPCWNPCCDPAWGSWQAFDQACNLPQEGHGGGHVGLVIVDDGGGDRPAVRGPRTSPAARPVHGEGLGAAPVAKDPAADGSGTSGAGTGGAAIGAGGPGRTPFHGPGFGARSPGDATALPAPAAGAPREFLIGRGQESGDGPAIAAGAPPRARTHRLIPGAPRASAPPAPAPSPSPAAARGSGFSPGTGGAGEWGRATAVARVHAVPAARNTVPPTTVEESAQVPSAAVLQAAANRPVRTVRQERPAPRPEVRGRDRDDGQDEAITPAPAAATAPAARGESRGGRSREEAPEARQPERTRPAPSSPPAESPRSHGGGRERTPDPSAPPAPAPPPPPPPPPANRGHHR